MWLLLQRYQSKADIVFSSVCCGLCMCVCLFLYHHYNSWAVEEIFISTRELHGDNLFFPSPPNLNHTRPHPHPICPHPDPIPITSIPIPTRSPYILLPCSRNACFNPSAYIWCRINTVELTVNDKINLIQQQTVYKGANQIKVMWKF